MNALLPSEGIKAAANLFGFIVECELRSKIYKNILYCIVVFCCINCFLFPHSIFFLHLVASASAFNDEGDSDYLRASVSGTEMEQIYKFSCTNIQLSFYVTVNLIFVVVRLSFSFGTEEIIQTTSQSRYRQQTDSYFVM